MKQVTENHRNTKANRHKLLAFVLYVFVFLLLSPTEGLCQDPWQLLYQPRQRIVKSIAPYKEQIFIGTGNGVFVSTDNGKSWGDFDTSQLQKDNSGNSQINWISIETNTETIYIATSFGAYKSSISKPDWQKFFEGSKVESNEVNSLAHYEDQVYLATNDGFWICNLNENNCTRNNNGLDADYISGNHEVFYTLKVENKLFIGTSNGIYFLDDKSFLWQKTSNGIQKLPDGNVNVRHLIVDKDKNFWAACGSGIYISKDNGNTWQKKSEGISKNNDGFQEAFYLFEHEDSTYASCASGVYYLDKGSWQDIGNGIRTKDGLKKVYWLSSYGEELLAATDEGLFRTTRKKDTTNNNLILKGKIETDFANLEEIEPTVVEVQKEALKFASLPTDKDYRRYRLQSRLRNLVPRVGIDLNDTGTNTNYNEFDKGISTNVSLNNSFDAGRTTRLQTDGKSFKQLSVLWNTNNLIFDDQIKEILNQARLTANIRENLLDDVTRIYYQRRKLQLQSLISPTLDTNEKLSKELEVAELTGQLDSRTGGWFSREIELRKNQ